MQRREGAIAIIQTDSNGFRYLLPPARPPAWEGGGQKCSHGLGGGGRGKGGDFDGLGGGRRAHKQACLFAESEGECCLSVWRHCSLAWFCFEAEGKNAASHLMVRGKDPLPENVADVSWRKGPRGREGGTEQSTAPEKQISDPFFSARCKSQSQRPSPLSF